MNSKPGELAGQVALVAGGVRRMIAQAGFTDRVNSLRSRLISHVAFATMLVNRI